MAAKTLVLVGLVCFCAFCSSARGTFILTDMKQIRLFHSYYKYLLLQGNTPSYRRRRSWRKLLARGWYNVVSVVSRKKVKYLEYGMGTILCNFVLYSLWTFFFATIEKKYLKKTQTDIHIFNKTYKSYKLAKIKWAFRVYILRLTCKEPMVLKGILWLKNKVIMRSLNVMIVHYLFWNVNFSSTE